MPTSEVDNAYIISEYSEDSTKATPINTKPWKAKKNRSNDISVATFLDHFAKQTL